MTFRVFHRVGLLLPAVTWLFIQFAMSGVTLASSTNGVQIVICSALGVQEVTIDPGTGQPVDPAIGSYG